MGSISPYEEASNPLVSIAGNRCQIGILDGLKADNEIVQVVSFRINRMFPIGKKIYVPRLHTVFNDLNYYFAPYLNIPFLRTLFVNANTFYYLLKKIKKNDIVLFYNVFIPFPNSVFFLRKLLGIKIYILAFDIHVPGQTVPNTIRWHYEYLRQKFVLPRVDGVIAITKTILEDFKCKKNPLIMEGGISRDLLNLDCRNANDGKLFKLLYAGALNKLNGIDLLLDAFIKNTNPHLRLIIAGSGELSDYVVNAANKDSRIAFLGIVPHKQIMDLYHDVSLLLCIRITAKIHTEYFFPSKLIEYLATGIPVLCTNLKSWNFNLNDFCYILKEETEDAIGLAINECISQYSTLIEKADLGKSFVRREMFWDVQGKRISNLLANDFS